MRADHGVALAPWEDSVEASFPFWYLRVWLGLAILLGHMLFIYNMYMTARSSKVVHRDLDYAHYEALEEEAGAVSLLLRKAELLVEDARLESAIILLTGFGLIAYAVATHPEGYQPPQPGARPRAGTLPARSATRPPDPSWLPCTRWCRSGLMRRVSRMAGSRGSPDRRRARRWRTERIVGGQSGRSPW